MKEFTGLAFILIPKFSLHSAYGLFWKHSSFLHMLIYQLVPSAGFWTWFLLLLTLSVFICVHVCVWDMDVTNVGMVRVSEFHSVYLTFLSYSYQISVCLFVLNGVLLSPASIRAAKWGDRQRLPGLGEHLQRVRDLHRWGHGGPRAPRDARGRGDGQRHRGHAARPRRRCKSVSADRLYASLVFN